LFQKDQDQFSDKVKKLATLFGFSEDIEVDWAYNAHVQRMECTIESAGKKTKQLKVCFEPGYPEYDASDKGRKLKYSEVRARNLRSAGKSNAWE
jgi:hypothetical protein